jgi:enoyl-CoA hydratase/carnithine racemase
VPQRSALNLPRKSSAAPDAIFAEDRLLREGQQLSLDSLLDASASAQAIAHKSREHREAVTAFIEKRRPDFERGERAKNS